MTPTPPVLPGGPRLFFSPGYPCGCSQPIECDACADNEAPESIQVVIGGTWLGGVECSTEDCEGVKGTYIADFEGCFGHPSGSEAFYKFTNPSAGEICKRGVIDLRVRIRTSGEIVVEVVIGVGDLHIYRLPGTGEPRDCMQFEDLDIPRDDGNPQLCDSTGSTCAISTL